LKIKYTFVAISEGLDLTRLIKLKNFFLSQIKSNKFVYINTRFVIMNYSNIIYFNGNKFKKFKTPIYLNSKKSLNLKKNYILKKFKNTYLHFVDDDTQFCHKCYKKLFCFIAKDKLNFYKINRKNVSKLELFSKYNLHKITINKIRFFKKLRFIISNSSIQSIFYNKKKFKNFKTNRGLGKNNLKIGSENIFISDNIGKDDYREISLTCPIQHLENSTGKKMKDFNLVVKSGHLQQIFKNLYKKNWFIFYFVYLMYNLFIKKLFNK